MNRTVIVWSINRESVPFIAKIVQSGREKPNSDISGSFFGFHRPLPASYTY